MAFNESAVGVAIIGAGISGISAAKILKKHGIRSIVLEGSHRIGGRAYTEELSPGNWFDLGCSYLHNGKSNPFLSIAESLKIPINTADGDLFNTSRTKYFSNGSAITLKDKNQLQRANDSLLGKIRSAKTDKSIFAFMDIDNYYFPILSHLYSSNNAADPDLVSSKDYRNSISDGPDYPVPNGFGNLVKAWSNDIPVQLNTQVKKIYWDKSCVRLETSKGMFLAQKLIITVSTGILANNNIEMVPKLPKEKWQAIENLPMGTLNKIGISFSKPSFSKKERGYYVSWPNKTFLEEKDVGSFEINVSGLETIVVFVGGRFGKWLEGRGTSTMRDYAMTKVEETLGNTYIKNVNKTITTAWASDPFSNGAYSYALPSNIPYRDTLGKSIENTIFFAGEATESSHFGTAHGAYFSGVRAAKEIVETNKI